MHTLMLINLKIFRGNLLLSLLMEYYYGHDGALIGL